MKLSAVAAFFAPPRPSVDPAKATGPLAIAVTAAKRTAEIEDTLELSAKALEQLISDDLPTEQANQSDPVTTEEPASRAEGVPDGRTATGDTATGDTATGDAATGDTATGDAEAGAPEKAADGSRPGSTEQLSDEQQQQVTELKQRDAEVRAHEQAHVAAGGPHVTGGPTYEYQEGPDGRQYAVGGEVQIDTSPVDGDPEATLRKAQIVRAAALAPAEPSSQDRAVAAAATQMAMQAQAELLDPTQVTESAEGDAGQTSAEPANRDAATTQTNATQRYAHQAITKAIAAQLKTTTVSFVDVYA